jgi:hypothetical protein
MRIVWRHDQTVHVRLYLMTSDNTFSVVMAIDIAVITNCCDPAIHPTDADRPDSARKPNV